MQKKLNAIGIDPSWFRSYLSGRKQTVLINGIKSDAYDIKCGVPQGSLLGPLLYLIYSNDMCISVRNKLLLYADDSKILVCDKNPEVVSKYLAEELDSCNTWLIDNKLSLHVGKTECILFGTKRKLSTIKSFIVNYKNHTLLGTKSVNNLCVTLDEDLAGYSMVLSGVPKVLGKLKFLYRHGHCLNID